MKRIHVSLVASAVTFFVCWHAVAIVLRAQENHTSFNSYIALVRLHSYIEELRDEEGALPTSERVNLVIQGALAENSIHESFELFDDPNFLLYELALEVSEERMFRLWDIPPIYVMSDCLPDGFGFYLAGEDSISKTSGMDRDDINSWDKDSYRYYLSRLHRQRSIRNSLAASVPALLIFGLLMKCQRKTTQQSAAGQSASGSEGG